MSYKKKVTSVIMLMFGNCLIPSYKYKSVFIVFSDVADNFISGDLIKLFQILLGL